MPFKICMTFFHPWNTKLVNYSRMSKQFFPHWTVTMVGKQDWDNFWWMAFQSINGLRSNIARCMEHFHGAFFFFFFWSFTAPGLWPLSLWHENEKITTEFLFFLGELFLEVLKNRTKQSIRLVVQQRSAATLWSLCGHRWWRSWQAGADWHLPASRKVMRHVSLGI